MTFGTMCGKPTRRSDLLYQLQHSASTATELAHSDEGVQARLGHRTLNMTKRYTHIANSEMGNTYTQSGESV